MQTSACSPSMSLKRGSLIRKGAHGSGAEHPSAVPDPTLKNFVCFHLQFSRIHNITTTPTMIQRTLLRHSRALASCRQSVPQKLLIRSQFRPANAVFAPVSRQVVAARFYATEPEAKAEGEATTTEGNGKENGENGTGEVEDPLKKELEAKNKEIIDLKVHKGNPLEMPVADNDIGSILALGSRIPESARADEERYADGEGLRHTEIRQGSG